MANQVMNFARGKIGYYMADALGLNPANSRMTIVVLEVNEADDTLNNHNELAALLAASNTEATATNLNSTREETDDTGITINIDDGANDAEAVLDSDVTWNTVSGTAATKLLTCYDADNAAGGDVDLVVLTHHDFAVTPNGGDITADFDQALGWWRST